MNRFSKNLLANYRWRRIAVAVALLLCHWPADHALALDPARNIFQYNCRTWSRQSGLWANTVNAIVQTKDGYIWLGTSAGLERFDGSEFKLYDISQLPDARSSIVSSLSKSAQDGIWFGMERGAFGFFDGNNISLLGRDEWGGLNLEVHSVLETKEGDLWIAAEVLVARLRSNTFETILNSSPAARYNVLGLFQDSRGRVWLGTSHQGLYYWQNGILTRFPDEVFDNLTIRCLVEDQQGQIWVGTDTGLICYDANLKRKPFPFPWYPIRALLVDKSNTLWIGTSGAGLVRYLNGIPIELRQKDGLADDFVTSLAEDEEGSLWIGTRNGLSQLSDVKIPVFGKADGLTANVHASVSSSRRGGLWVATSDGFTYFDGFAHPHTNIAGLDNPYLTKVFEAKNGDLYLINGSMGVNVFSAGKVVATYPNKVWPTAMVEDDRSVIVSMGGELFRVGTNFFEPYEFADNQKPPLTWIFNMDLSRDGSIWISADEGICRVRDDTFEFWSTERGPRKSKVRWVCEDSDGVVWAGLETGIARLKNGIIQNITRDHGLFDNFIHSIVPDDHGDLWVNASRGIFQISRKNLNDFCDGRTNRVISIAFDGPDSVKSAEKYQEQPSGCKTLDGRIWFPTAHGIVMIDPTNITVNPVPPKIHIQDVRANGQDVFGKSRAMARPGNGELEFHYAGISFLAPLKLQYRYKLEGYDKDWVDAGNRRSAFYANLKPGAYTFHVKARKEGGAWNSAGDSFAVALTPFVYQTIWFRGLAGALVIAGAFGIYGWRIRHLSRRQEQLQQARDFLDVTVKERTAELRVSNRSLKNEIEERKRAQSETERLQSRLLETSRQAGMAEVATNVLHNVGNVLNSVNISASLVAESVKKFRASHLSRVVTLLREHSHDLGDFITNDPKGKHVPAHLASLSEHLLADQTAIVGELDSLRHNIEHIKEIVAMQQNYATAGGVKEMISVVSLVEDSLRINEGAMSRHRVKVIREFEDVPPMNVEKHKILQILVNLLRNAKYACDESGHAENRVTVRVANGEGKVKISVMDNGVGIPTENLARIFSHGFTTRKTGHGFGLHSGALAANDMGGALTVHSDGPGHGAVFTLELPVQPEP